MYRIFQIVASIGAILLGVSLLVAGAYGCIILGFFGGISTVIDSVKETPTNALWMCWGAVKIVFCWVPITLGAFFCWILVVFGSTGLADTRWTK